MIIGDDAVMIVEAQATPRLANKVIEKVREAGYQPPAIAVTRTEKRGNIANIVWNQIREQTIPRPRRMFEQDADGDQIPSVEVAQPSGEEP